MIETAVMIVLVCACIYLLYKYKQLKGSVMRVSRELAEMGEEESTRRKILIRRNAPFSEIVFSINAIIDKKNTEIEKLKLSEKAHRSLLTNLAHDLRTPLTTLIGYLEAMDMDLNREKNAEYLQTALSKAKQLKDNVNQIFEWAKLYSNTDELNLKRTDLSEYTRMVLIDWVPIFEKRNINYDIDIPDSRLDGYIDEISYQTVINNLIKNIIEHADAKNVKVRLTGEEEKIKLEISDDGVGIDPGLKEKIFEEFFKVSGARGGTGSGLGLSIVRLLVEKQKGNILVDTGKNKGTSFKITFPRVE
ncbi:putative sensor histidine kinase [Thermoclostridium stercorarium subsp. stercorarium DSM 8532]|jgi:signal transduction histidine kinase|uniref:histidine kinase n=3 Tax=Thermoclostridium stercorarium TaxID=1510 RepID=L7VIL6_THES1|nr:HAMP domain-containing sensor histidine kinase [Thermoclostridium stercorarium]AGC67905.1 putative sensor histidine kinase [Thermoclostridium stercorarium subsp. stercorarium DSM 8532]AGI38946.1 histidine kinase [Thermoclostridium stercorarium subsp. stercorarium DSM 8532]ANW98314.1 histidine kinase [Thermoclostridium stercorarium subsp. thermolacticum DSM 2910]ANX00841.1 histidine kinase [Thermoclostridium stercorarium subsp. leptospartum DSM 9219]UZQ86453.1 HAMP domain-containing histidin